MIPILYEANETKFETNGIGRLPDCISCLCTEERNGAYTVTLTYPINGINSEELAPERIIAVIAHEGDTKTQPFRIVSIKTKDRIKTVECQHISYQLNSVYARPYNDDRFSDDPNAWMVWIENSKVGSHPFRLSTDFKVSGTRKLTNWTVPRSIKSLLLGSEGSILDVYGGEYLWDRYNVKLLKNRGADRGVKIAYGKNLISADQEIDITDAYNAVIGYYCKVEEDMIVCKTSSLQSKSEHPFAYNRTKLIDFSGEFDKTPTVREVNEKTLEYLNANYSGMPDYSVNVEFLPLHKTMEYKDLALVEHVGLCDTVTVSYPTLGIQSKTKVVKTVYDVLMDRYDHVEIGEIRQSVADSMVKLIRDQIGGLR